MTRPGKADSVHAIFEQLVAGLASLIKEKAAEESNCLKIGDATSGER